MSEEPIITVRRQWNDWRRAQYRLAHIQNLHWDDVSGGINVRAPRSFIHGYVFCDGMIDGELAHSCRHGPPPHLIKVCILKVDNKGVFKMVEERMRAKAAGRPTAAHDFMAGRVALQQVAARTTELDRGKGSYLEALKLIYADANEDTKKAFLKWVRSKRQSKQPSEPDAA